MHEQDAKPIVRTVTSVTPAQLALPVHRVRSWTSSQGDLSGAGEPVKKLAS